MEENIIKHFELKDYELWNQELLQTGCVVIKNILTK